MSYCINLLCSAPNCNSADQKFCASCGTNLLLKGRYRALNLLGQGGFGRTFKAVDEDRPGRPLCVIKQFTYKDSNPGTQRMALSLFYEEAKHLQELGSHPQIPELLAYFDVEEQPYLVQQYADGHDLEKELEAEGAFSQQKIEELLKSLLPVLDFLHNQTKPVIHRDIKPANIIRQRDGTLMLVDFGAVKQVTQTMLAKTGTMIGSPEFAAPEQTRGKPVFASDIYSLGVSCIHLLTNMSPFDLFDTSEDAWVWRHYLVDNPVDRILGEVLDRSITNAVKLRYQSASEMMIALNYKLRFTQPMLGKIRKMPEAPVASVIRFEASDLTMVLEPFSYKMAYTVRTRLQEWEERRVSKEGKRFIEKLFHGGIEIEMIEIPGAEFLMGSSDDQRDAISNEKPQHYVKIPPFFMGRYPITQAQYTAIMGENPSYSKGDYLPVENVSWHEAQAFCLKLSEETQRKYSLPSEAQWEYACRSGTNTLFHFGEKVDTSLINYNTISNDEWEILQNVKKVTCLQGTNAVGYFNRANKFGLSDMHGNVWEWVEDDYNSSYLGAPTNGTAWTTNTRLVNLRVMRGGSWRDPQIKCRSAARSFCHVNVRQNNIGFRVIHMPQGKTS